MVEEWVRFMVLMDLLTISFMKTFLTRPMHVFGLFGLISMVLGTVLILVVLLLVTGVQLFSFGLLAELLVRTYHESQGRPIYRLREVVGKNIK